MMKKTLKKTHQKRAGHWMPEVEVPFVRYPELYRKSRRETLYREAERIMGSEAGIDSEDETLLFKAMHACGYALNRQLRTKELTAHKEGVLRGLRARIVDFIVNQNIGLIYEMRRRVQIREIDPDDMTSEGFWTLFRAAEGFDPWRGFKFSTYACTSILRGYLLLGRKRQQRADHLGRLWEDADPVPTTSTQEPSLERQLLIEKLRRALSNNDAGLTPTEQFIIQRRLLHSPAGKPQTLESIGEMFDLSKERIRQIQLRALGKLRTALSDDEQEAAPSDCEEAFYCTTPSPSLN